MAASPLLRIRGTLDILRHLPGQRRAHYRSRRRLDGARDRSVCEVVRHAVEHVPFYRALVSAQRLDPDAIRTADDLEKLPLLDRELVQSLEREFRSEATSGTTAIAFRTTGSTAAPQTVYHDRRSLLANIAYSERERAVETRLLGRRYRYSVLDIRAPRGTAPTVQRFYGEASFRPFRPRRRLISTYTPPEQMLAAVNELRPEVIRSYAAYLELLFKTAAVSGSLEHRPGVVLYSGDVMSTAGRELIEEEFGIPVASLYNAVEAFKIAFTCEARAGFHIHEDLCHVRVVGPGGEGVAPGEHGEVVISNLVNRGTVLLNYRLGDFGRLVEERCECGRTSRRLVDLQGRIDELLDLGDGAYVYPTQLWDAFRGRPQILRYQLVQHAERRFELKVVISADALESERILEEAAAELRSTLRGAGLEVTRHEELATGPGGKFRPIVPLRSRQETSETERAAR
jgi:phenylacetate-CoA ligase